MSLVTSIKDINQREKEDSLQKKAEELSLGYVNFADTKINTSALSLIKEEESEKLKIICFFAVKKKIRIGVLNPENTDTQLFIEGLKAQGYSININLISEESFNIAFGFYNEIEEKIEFDEKISSSSNFVDKNDEINENGNENSEDLNSPILNKTEEKNNTKEDENDNEDFFEDRKFLKNLYSKAMEMGVSDLHFEAGEKVGNIKIRLHGMLRSFKSIDKKLYDKIIMNLKHKSNLILNEKNIPQDGKFFIELQDRKVDMRVSIIPSFYGENIVIRILDPLSTKVNLSDLGFFDFQIEMIKKNITKNQGAILVSGPTGSGKTSTLYSFLKQLNNGDKKIISLEDPVEYHFEGIVQSDVNKKMSFESGLKACLRHDPDIIMLGEIRTKESAEIAMEASLTGHLLLSTIHTNSAVDTLFRLKNFGIKDYLINSSVNLILAQRLVKRLCQNCKIEKEFSKSELDFIKKLKPKIGIKTSEMKKGFVSEGCEKCHHTGVGGREMICEVLEIDEDVRNFLLDSSKNFSELKNFLRKEKNFLTLQEFGIVKVLKGKVSFDEILSL